MGMIGTVCELVVGIDASWEWARFVANLTVQKVYTAADAL
jgi:hypothetical protein